MRQNGLHRRFLDAVSLVMLTIYLVSTIGFGVHTCNYSRASYVFVAGSEDSCSCVHDDVAEPDLLVASSINPEQCCTSDYYQIDPGQVDTRESGFDLFVPFTVLRNADVTVEVSERSIVSFLNESRRVPVDISTFCSQWRI